MSASGANPPISPSEAAAARRILVVNVTRIGDTLLATPAIRAIARYFPNAELTVLGHPKRVEVLKNIPYIQRVGGIDKNTARLRGWLDALSSPEYDWAFVWRTDQPLVNYALRKARRVVAHQQSDLALTRRLAYVAPRIPDNTVHAVAWALSVPQSAGIPPAGFGLDYVVTPAERDRARQRLRQAHVTTDAPLISLQVASFPTKQYRDWPIEHFISLARRMIAAWPEVSFLLNGGTADREKINCFIRHIGERACTFAGELSLRESAAMMEASTLYIGVDTGPSHIFGALKKPMIVMYHPSLPSALYKPLDNPGLFAIDHPGAGPTASERIPMAEISVDRVWSAVQAAMRCEPSTLPGGASPGIDQGASPFSRRMPAKVGE